MSEQEQHAIVGQTALEHSEAKRKLAMLESKARSSANSMRIVAYALHPTRITESFDSSSETFAQSLSKCLNRDEIMALLEEIKITKSRIEELSKALREMGVSA